jgi:hypothetical protein
MDLHWSFTASEIPNDLAAHPKLGVPASHRFSVQEIPRRLAQTLPLPHNFRHNAHKELLSLVHLRT